MAAVLVACLASFPSPGQQQRPSQGLGGASFAPFFFPNSGRIIFASNYENPGTSQFQVCALDRDGGGLGRITYSEGFSSFLMFSADG